MASNIFLVFVICIAIILNNFNYSGKWEVGTRAIKFSKLNFEGQNMGWCEARAWVLGWLRRSWKGESSCCCQNFPEFSFRKKAQMGQVRNENTCSAFPPPVARPQLKLSAKFTYIRQTYPLAQFIRQRKTIFLKVYFCRLSRSFMEHVKSWRYCQNRFSQTCN